MAVRDVTRYIGERNIPHDVRRRRKYVSEAMRRMGTPVIVKHMFNAQDVLDGIAQESPNYYSAYDQVRHNDPFSFGTGFVSVETTTGEWIAPDGELVIASTKPSSAHLPAPKYRGFGPGFLTYIILPDVAEDVFKLTESGVLIKTQTAQAQATWYPEMNDNDLLIIAQLDRVGAVIDTRERYQLKQTTAISTRGYDRKGRRESTEDFGNRHIVNQTFELTLVPTSDPLYAVEIDR